MKNPLNDSISRLAFANSFSHWRYSLSTILVVGIGLLSIWTFRGYMARIGDMYRDHFTARSMFGEIIIEHIGAADNQDIGGVNARDQGTMQEFFAGETQAISQVVRFLRIDGQIGLGPDNTVFEGLAYDIAPGEAIRGKKWAWNAVAGRALKGPQEVIMGRALASLLGCEYDAGNYLQRLGEGPGYIPAERPFTCVTKDALVTMVSETGRVRTSEMNVVGLMDVGFRDLDRTWMMMGLEEGQMMLGTKDLSWISLQAKGDSSELLKRTQAYIIEKKLPLQATIWHEHRFTDLYRRTMALLGVFETFVLSILSGIVGISVFNLMSKVVSERRREIGLLRSIGFGSPKILRLFLSEATLTTLMGLILGSIASLLFVAGVNSIGVFYKAGILSESVPFSIATPFPLWLSTALMLGIVSLLASFLAVRKALKKTVIECLI